jgi:hypothetical protein
MSLTAWDTKEKAARERAEALNSFEAYMFVCTLLLLLPPPELLFRYMMREKLDESAEWKAVTNEEQRQACTEAVAAAVNWFDEEVGVDTNTSQFEQQLRKLKKLGDPIEFRVQVQTLVCIPHSAQDLQRCHSHAEYCNAYYHHLHHVSFLGKCRSCR